MAGHWHDDKPKRRTLPPRRQRLADEIQARAMELRDNSEEGLSIREAVALAAVQLGMAPDANAEVHQDASFWDHVKKLRNGCWEWQGRRTPAGYGTFRVDGRPMPAHRYAYESRIGPIPPRLVIDHHIAYHEDAQGRQTGKNFGGCHVFRTNRWLPPAPAKCEG